MTAEEILTKLQASFPGLAKSDAQVKNYPTWTVPARSVRAVCERLRSRFSFDYLDVITAVDWSGPVSPKGYPVSSSPGPGITPPPHPSSAGRDIFELVYLVSALSAADSARGPRQASVTTGMKLCLRCELPRKGTPSVPSLYGLFMAADWQEREVYDLFGIHFEGHPNLKRILTPETQQGYPLRKDYEHVPDSCD